MDNIILKKNPVKKLIPDDKSTNREESFFLFLACENDSIVLNAFIQKTYSLIKLLEIKHETTLAFLTNYVIQTNGIIAAQVTEQKNGCNILSTTNF